MKEFAFIYPVLAHLFLVLGLYIILGLRKSTAVKKKSVDLKDASLNNQAWPPAVVQVSNNIANQFESPILFYALCFIGFLTGIGNVFVIFLCWSYVFLRYVHSYVHISKNIVPYRLRVFVLSLLVLLAFLIQTIFQLATAN